MKEWKKRLSTKKRRILFAIVVVLIISSSVTILVFGLGKLFNKTPPEPAPNTGRPSSDADSQNTTQTFAPSGNVFNSSSLEPSLHPSPWPSTQPSVVPSVAPSVMPSSFPSVNQSSPAPMAKPTFAPPREEFLTKFCVIADAPYDDRDRERLPGQISDLPDGCEFLIHLGDIKSGATSCTESEYTVFRQMMDKSPVMAMAVLGDNEWNDCPDIKGGWQYWRQHVMGMYNNWQHNFDIYTHPSRPENFSFIHKGTLFIGLNIVGGQVHDKDEWASRLTALYEWTEELIITHVVGSQRAKGVVLMSHAKPVSEHNDYYNPLKRFVGETLDNEYPIMCLHGDGHEWIYTKRFLDQSNLLRIQHQGGTDRRALIIYANPVERGPRVHDAFWYER